MLPKVASRFRVGAAASAQETQELWRLSVYGLLVGALGHLAYGAGSNVVPATWMILFMAIVPALAPWRYVLATFLSLLVYCDQSLWFTAIATPTVYERDILVLKPPELLFGVIALRWMFSGNALRCLPAHLKFLGTGWLTVVVIGLVTALSYGNSLHDVFIFSEFRTLLVFYASVLFIYQRATHDRSFLIKYYCTAVCCEIAISVVSQTTGFPILWRNYAPGYVEQLTAFYGSDEAVKVALFAFTLCASYLFLRPAGMAVDMGRRKWWFVGAALSGFAILASMRRGGIIATAIVLCVLLSYSRFRMRTVSLLGGCAVLVAVIMVAVGPASIRDLPGPIRGAIERFDGIGAVRKSDWGHSMDVEQSWEYVTRHPVLGTGPGTRLRLERLVAYNSEPDALSIHQNILHTWVRYGLPGVIMFIITFALPLVTVLRSRTRRATSLQASLMASAAYLVSELVWSLATPPFYMNFRHSALVAIALALIYHANEQVQAVRKIPRSNFNY